MDNQKLLKYKGWIFNRLTVNTIEYEFNPYKLEICNIDDFNNEVYLHNTIRCLISRDIILDLKFN